MGKLILLALAMGCGAYEEAESAFEPGASAEIAPQNALITNASSVKRNSGDLTGKKLADIAVTPALFVVQQQGNIYEDYILQEKVGEGTFGVVYKAIHKLSQEKRAIKMIKKIGVSLEEEDKIRHEIDILKQMDHPNIVKLYEFYSDEKFYYMVTELIEGGELFDEILRRKCFTEENAAEILVQLLSAVIYCHERCIVHRDIKPENVLIDRTSQKQLHIKIIDFGTAKAFNPLKKLRATAGTAYYIAPEVLLKSYDEKCDVWSCGVILYILLCGSPPFNGKDDAAIFEAIKRTTFSYDDKIWKKVSSSAKDLINKMLTYPPKSRISAAEAHSHAWLTNKKFNTFNTDFTQGALESLTSFMSKQKLQQASLMYIVTQLVNKDEKDKLKETFMALDQNADGKLSRAELLHGYTKLYGNEEKARIEVDNIMNNVDVDNNGYIDYSEFLLASSNKKKVLSKQNLQKAFSIFDKDGNGFISADEIKAILGFGRKFSEDVWKQAIEEVDQNNDGLISFDEFECMMSKFV